MLFVIILVYLRPLPRALGSDGVPTAAQTSAMSLPHHVGGDVDTISIDQSHPWSEVKRYFGWEGVRCSATAVLVKV